MGRKHRTKILSIPTKVITIPVASVDEEVLAKMPLRWINAKRNASYRAYVVAFKDDNGRYQEFSFKPEELDKKTNKNKIKGQLRSSVNGWSFWVHNNLFLPIDRLYFVYMENKMETIYNIDDILRDYQKYINTKKTTYADWIVSCGQDFTYEQPYGHLLLQPKLRKKHIELRKKWIDNPRITFCFDDLQLFRDVQKLLVDKYNAVGERRWKEKKGRLDYDGYHPYKTQDEYPTYSAEHLEKPLIYPYLRIGNTVGFMESRNPRIKVKCGSDDDYPSSSLYKRQKYITIKTIEEADEILNSYQKYIKLVLPKQREP